MFRGHHRKVRMLFGLLDIPVTGAAFALAYSLRERLHLPNAFFLSKSEQALLLALSIATWLALGFWWDLYDRVDSAHPRVILRDAFRQCLAGAVLIIVFEYVLRLDLSRTFVALFAAFAWVLLCIVRLNGPRIVRSLRREFGAAHYVMIAGLGEPARRLGRQLEESAQYPEFSSPDFSPMARPNPKPSNFRNLIPCTRLPICPICCAPA